MKVMQKNTYKLICSDIDGTLLNKDKSLSINTIQEFQRLHSQEIPVILASARMPKSVRAILNEANINQIIIAYNGALIEHLLDEMGESEELLNVKIPKETSIQISELCQKRDIHCSLYHKDSWFPDRMDFWTEREIKNTRIQPQVLEHDIVFSEKTEIKGFHKIMCMGEESKIAELHTFLVENFAQKVAIYRTKNTYIEISPLNVNKFTALSHLCNHLKINISDVIAFGDNYNDIEMIAEVGMGIAVENAVAELKAVAKFITHKNTEDGVAHALKKWF